MLNLIQLMMLRYIDRQQPLHRRDCACCEYRRDDWRDGGHCYFFREEPSTVLCAHFQQDPQIRLKELEERENVDKDTRLH